VVSSAAVHVLIVDDDEGIRETLRFALEGEGYAVLEAQHGLAALEILAALAVPLVVLVDLRMPLLDGEGLLDAVCADPLLAHRHVYALTTANEQTLTPHLRRTLARLDAPVVGKPFDLDHLLEVVHRLALRLVPPDTAQQPSVHAPS
jgi:two-component system chemotaxis response regulator CheY